jgi:dTMP kinase
MISRDPHKGCFITFEGVEGTGKTTHLKVLEARLQQEGYAVTCTREPGGTPLGEGIRDLFLHSQDPGPESELFLILAARADHVTQVLVPNLNSGQVVLCDRFSHATLAYQGGGRGLPFDVLQEANDIATGGLVPDQTLLLDAPAEQLLERLQHRASRKALDRIDQETAAFFKRVRQAYFDLAQNDSAMVVIDSSATRNLVAESIWLAVRPVVEARRGEGCLI